LVIFVGWRGVREGQCEGRNKVGGSSASRGEILHDEMFSGEIVAQTSQSVLGSACIKMLEEVVDNLVIAEEGLSHCQWQGNQQILRPASPLIFQFPM
jgi:hypothetical protein